MTEAKKFNLSEIMFDPSNKTILILQDQSPDWRSVITRRTVTLVEAILNKTTTATVCIEPFKTNDSNTGAFLCSSIVLTVDSDRVGIAKARGMQIVENSILVY